MSLSLTQTANNVTSITNALNTSGSALGAASSLGSTDPVGSLVATGTNIVAQLLPPDKRDKFLQGVTFGLVGLVLNWIKGRPYTEGQYVLGERYVDHILNKAVDRSYAKDHPGVVANAITFFTGALGVRIKTSEDLDALNGSPAYAAGEQLERGAKGMIDLGRTIVFPFTYKGVTYTSSKGKADKAIPNIPGVDLYYMRPDHKDIPLKAVQRAAMLIQQYYPYRSYNKGAWDLQYMTKFPIVAPIPDPLENGKLMNGVLPGGMTIKNGLIAGAQAGDLLTQDLNALPGQTTSEIASNNLKKWLLISIVGVLVIVLIIIFIRNRKK